MKIAFLKYPSYQKSRSGNFEGKSNIGAHVVIDMLNKKGYECDIVKLKETNNYDLILISFSSIWDVISFCRHVHKSKIWNNRKFKVMAGGFGMQSHFNLNGFIDYAYYGRLEDINIIINRKGRYLYDVNYIGEIEINKGNYLYPYELEINGFKWRETLSGCPMKCKFCNYSATRNYISKKNNHGFNFYSKKTSIELDFKSYKNYQNQSNVTIGLDGWSEKIRFSMNKKISNELIKKALIYISNKSTCKAVRIKLYNIEGFKNESDNDMFEFIENLYSIIPYLKTKLFIIIHSTPLFPSKFTCVENYNIRFDLNLHKRKSFCKYIKHPLLTVEDDNYNSSDAVNMEGVIAQKGTKMQFDTIIKNSDYKKQNVENKIKWFKNEQI
jgi:hypothetical protein